MRIKASAPAIPFTTSGLSSEQAEKFRAAKVIAFIPVYNHADYLRFSLTSVAELYYLFPENLTVVIYDDASNDNSVEIIENFVSENEFNFRVAVRKTKENLRGQKRSQIIEEFRPDYMMICCDDDIQFPYRLVKTVIAHIKTGAHVVTSNAALIDADGRSLNMVKTTQAETTTLQDYAERGHIATCFGAGVSHSREIFDVFGPLPRSVRNSDLIVPFRAGLLSPQTGNYFIMEPQFQWRIHKGMSTLNPNNDNTRSERENFLARERWLNNMILNYSHLLDNFALRQQNFEPALSDDVGRKIGDRRECFIREWCDLRQRMADVGYTLS